MKDLRPKWITVKQYAEIMGVCTNTAYKLVRENAIPHKFVGGQIRIHRRAVEEEEEPWAASKPNNSRTVVPLFTPSTG